MINDLEALLYELQLAAEPWREEFIEAWSALEIPYAVALDRLKPLPTAQDADVAEGLAQLRSLVSRRLEELDV